MAHNYKIVLWNANGLTQRRHEIEIFLITEKIDILLISETHFTSKSYFSIPGYNCYHSLHPDDRAHAGTAIIIKKSICHHELEKWEKDYIQATSISITDINGSHIVISAIYCPPRHTISIEQFTNFFNSLGPKFIAGGDYNSKHISFGSRVINPKGRNLFKTISNKGYNVISTGKPTYWPTDPNRLPDLLDFFVTKGFSNSYIFVEECLDLSSDHTPVTATISTLLIIKKEKEKSPSLYNKKTNWDLFKIKVEEKLNLKLPLKTEEDIELAIEHFNKHIQDAAWISTPELDNQDTQINYPIEIKEKLKEKRRLRKIWQRTHYITDKLEYNRAAKMLKNLIWKNKNDTLQDYLSKLSPQGTNEYSLWKATKYLKRPKQFSPPIKTDTNTWARTNHEKAEIFAKHLKKTFIPFPQTCSNLENSEIESFLDSPLQLSPPIPFFSSKEIEKQLKNESNKKKSPGYDLITVELLKKLPRKGIILLTEIFNAILRVRYFPIQWKHAIIIMIIKPGKNISEVSSYRPISLLPHVSKIFEKLLLKRIKSCIEFDEIIPFHQYGFRAQHSTSEQIHRIVNNIEKALEEKNVCTGVFLDVKQAFDKVWHHGLLYKIKKIFPDQLYWILKSYLENRWFQVRIENEFSQFHPIKSGVPQGSILGPFLYSIFTADIPTHDDLFIATYADDTALMVSNSDPDTASNKLQEYLNNTQNWFHKWRIQVNEAKSTHISFTNRKIISPPVYLNSKQIPYSNSVKYLGMHLDQRLTWKNHIEKKRNEINIKYKRMYWLLGKNSQLALKSKVLLYKSMLKPIWSYSCQTWGAASESNISKIQRIQSKILRGIANAPWYVTNECLHNDLMVPSVRKVILDSYNKHIKKLENHSNISAINLLDNSQVTRRLKKNHILDTEERATLHNWINKLN